MEQCKISVITASYNSVKTIEQTITSVISQTYNNIELIVIDGGSKDGTLDILRKYENEISFWISEPDRGVYDAFNKGVQHAHGDFIQFLGSDDCLCEETTIENVVKLIDDNTDILSTPIWLVDEERQMQKIMSNSNAKEKAQFDGKMIPHPGMFARKELLMKYPFDVSYRIAADYLFFLICYYDTDVNFKFVDIPTVFFATTGLSSTSSALLENEKRKVRNQFGIVIREPAPSKLKKYVKQMMKIMHVFETVRLVTDLYIRRDWIRHRCNWANCRWCGRGV